MPGRSLVDTLIVRGRSVLQMNTAIETATVGVPDGTIRLWQDGSLAHLQVFARNIGTVGAWTEIGMADFLIEVRKGNVTGHAMATIAGHAPAIGTTSATVAPFGTPQIIETIAAAALVAVASTSTADTSAGTGLRTALLSGLDASGNAQTETITLNGQTKVASANTYTSWHGLVGLTAGSGLKNAGILYVGLNADTFTSGVPTTLLGAMEAGWNIARTAYYMIPTGKTGYIVNAVFSSGPGKIGTGRVVVRTSGGLWLELFELNESDSTITVPADGSPALAAGTEIRLDGEVSATTGAFTFNVVLLLVDD